MIVMWNEVVTSICLLKQRLSCCLKLFDFSGDFVWYLPLLWYPGRGYLHARVVVVIYVHSGVVIFKINFSLEAFLGVVRDIVGNFWGWAQF